MNSHSNYFDDIENACLELLSERKSRFLKLMPIFKMIENGDVKFPEVDGLKSQEW